MRATQNSACGVGACVAALFSLAWSPPVSAAKSPRENLFLGPGAKTGDLCQASRVWDDPVASAAGVRAWRVTCRGSRQPLGRLYLFTSRAGAVQGPQGVWRTALAQRADCGDPPASRPFVEPGVWTCKAKPSGAPYVVYWARRGGAIMIAEGLALVSDVLQTGLKVVSGDQAPLVPTPEQRAQVDVASRFGAPLQISAAGEIGAESAESRREVAYREMQAWDFGQAEAQFGQILGQSSLTPASKAEDSLSLALMKSNIGRFSDADSYFALADRLIGQVDSPAALVALSLNDKAMHARNQQAFDRAIALSRQAIALRQGAEATSSQIVRRPSGDLVIGPGLATALNTAGTRFSVRRLSFRELERIRDAQAYEVEGASLKARGRLDEARSALEQADRRLAEPALTGVDPWLAGRTQRELAEIEFAEGARSKAIGRLSAVIAEFRARDPGSLIEGFDLIELARWEAAEGDLAGSVKDYETAFARFRSRRGALGASADMSSAYFEELLTRIGSDPAAHRQDVDGVFNAAQALISQSSAEAAASFAARISQGDSASALLSRDYTDTSRQIDAKQSQLDALQAEVRRKQADNSYAGPQKVQLDLQLAAVTKDLGDLSVQNAAQFEKLLAANPGYGAMLRTSIRLSDLQGALNPGEVYVKIILLADRGYGLLVTHDDVQPYRIDLTRNAAEALVTRLRKPFDDIARTGRLSSYNVALAHDLYQHLFGPVADRVVAASRLIYEPDATLIGVPVAALVTDTASVDLMAQHLTVARASHTPLNYAGVSWLGARLESSVAVSASNFYQLRRLGAQLSASKAPQAFIGFGDPVVTDSPREFRSVSALNPLLGLSAGDDACAPIRQALFHLSPLNGAADEVRTVGASLNAPLQDQVLGSDFTDSAIVAAGAKPGGLDQFQVIYFATHGLLPLPNGCLKPSLVTSLASGDANSDGLLDMDKIVNLKLDAELVVLAACDTGSAGAASSGETAVNGGGEALGGLVRAFISAGARNLVVSNWQADSTATEKLMTAMFSSKGATQGAALRQAQVSLMNDPVQYSHPGFWAAFTVVGDAARPMPTATARQIGVATR